MNELDVLRGVMVKRLEEAWDGISDEHAPVPGWLAQLALQLELWVGDELEGRAVDGELTNPLYYIASWDEPAAGARRIHEDMKVAWDARQSDKLYLRALTANHFVDVEVEKEIGTAEPTSIKLFIVPRDRLRKLGVGEMVTRGTQPDALRMTLTYEGDERSFDVPRGETHDQGWRKNGLVVFRELKGDLRKEPMQGGEPVYGL